MKIHIRKFLFFIIGISFSLAASFRPIGFDLDSYNYSTELLFTSNQIDLISKEPAYWLIQQENLLIFNGWAPTFFLAFSILAVTLKIKAINRMSSHPYMSFFVYFSFYFILQEMTQIRAGVAIAFFFLSIIYLVKRKFILFALCIFLATLFHYSAIIFLPLYLIKPTLNKLSAILFSILPLTGLIISSLNPYNLVLYISNFLPAFLSTKINIYYNLSSINTINKVDPINKGNLFMLFIFYISLSLALSLQRKITTHKNKNYIFSFQAYIISIKLLSIGFFILFGLSFIEVFSYRIANYLFTPLILIIPFFASQFKEKIIINLTLYTFIAYTLLKNIFTQLNIKALM